MLEQIAQHMLRHVRVDLRSPISRWIAPAIHANIGEFVGMPCASLLLREQRDAKEGRDTNPDLAASYS